MRAARPIFPWQDLPEVPGELGYYDLRDPGTRKAQAALASAHGIDGFCYYHYWFEGRRLLDQPIDAMLESGEPDFPFCLCWANENWTRAWDGLERHVLLAQTYSPEDDRNHMRWLVARAFADPRYIRIDGRPLFLVYRATRLPDAARTAALWRQVACEAGLPGLYLAAVRPTKRDHIDPRSIGFDAGVEFQPDFSKLGRRLGFPPGFRILYKLGLYKPLARFLQTLRVLDPTYRKARVYRYDAVMHRSMRAPEPPYTLFPGVFPSWDNTPRRRNENSSIIAGSTPAKFERWLRSAAERAARNAPGERIVFINAWNEWGEGNHLEPSRSRGRSYLEAVASVARDPSRRAVASGANHT